MSCLPTSSPSREPNGGWKPTAGRIGNPSHNITAFAIFSVACLRSPAARGYEVRRIDIARDAAVGPDLMDRNCAGKPLALREVAAVLGVRLPADELTRDVFCRAVMTSPYFLATGEWRHASVHRMVELDRDTEFAAPPRAPYTA